MAIQSQPIVAGEAYQGRILRETKPVNLEYPFATLDNAITSNEKFYVRSHHPFPDLNLHTWRLAVAGEVEKPLELTYEDLLAMAAQTTTVTLECAGNQRVFLVPTAEGAQWSHGAVSTAAWTGVPLQVVLDRAGVKANAIEIVIEGADQGEIKESPKPTGSIQFARSMPLNHAGIADVLLAYQMNGKQLPQAHGFPVRLIVPGWYGMASVKWVTRLMLTATPFHGYYQSIDYAIWQRVNDIPTRIPITLMQPKAVIARPDLHEVIPRNESYRMHGAAWTGHADIEKVEISVDSGETWRPAKLLGEPARHVWRLWEHTIPPFPHAGFYMLMAKATDTKGNTQAMERQPDRENYMITHVIPIPIEVR